MGSLPWSYVGEKSVSRSINLKGKSPVTLTWRAVKFLIVNETDQNEEIEGQILENFLYGTGMLLPDEIQALYVDFLVRHSHLKKDTKEFGETLINDDYFNCLLIKYGYAITCHKSQGGEWDDVFTVWDHENSQEFDFLSSIQKPAGKTNLDFYRWAYTAITRSSKKNFLINSPSFSPYSKMTFITPEIIGAIENSTGSSIAPEIIHLDTELTDHLKDLNIAEYAIEIQDYFIKIRHKLRSYFIDIHSVQKNGYEIRFGFTREGKSSVFKTAINGQNQFKNKLIPIPKLSMDAAFNKELTDLLEHLPNVSVIRNTPETIIAQVEFESDIEEKLPFTKVLFDDLSSILFSKSITVQAVEHLSYKERYYFIRNSERLTIDFEYNGDGFFGRVIPHSKKANSNRMISDLESAIIKLKNSEYAS